MNFLDAFGQPALLGGLLLVGVPVAIHLIMRQKPKHLLFPALRFLVQRHRTNQRKMQLRHFLLLGLRMLLIALACLALTRPRVHSERFSLTPDHSRAVALIVDTSPSMEYKIAGKTRLDDARRLAFELIDDLPPGSKVAVLDTASAGGEWETAASARGRVAALQIQSANAPITSPLANAYDLFARLKQDGKESRKSLIPLLFVFSDRTEASWDRNQVEALKRIRDRATEPIHAVYVDVGADKPEDLAIVDLKLKRQVLAPGEPVQVSAIVQATNRPADLAVVFQIDDAVVARKAVTLEAGKAQGVSFEQLVDRAGPHQVVVKLEVNDAALAFNDERYATFEVRGGRKVLTLSDEPAKVKDWDRAVTASRFTSEVKTPADVAGWAPKDFGGYHAVALVNVSKPRELRVLWEKLADYVRDGGGLIVVPAGGALNTDEGKKAYNDDKAAQGLLPGTLGKIGDTKDGQAIDWDRVRYPHPIFAPFRDWFGKGFMVDYRNAKLGPKAFRHWELTPTPDQASVLAPFANKDQSPLLMERRFDPKAKVRGRALMLAVPMDDRTDGTDDRATRWHDYLEVEPSFYFVLVKQSLGYLAGDDREEQLNFQCGQNVVIPVPASPRFPNYTIQGPGLHASDAVVALPEGETELRIPQAVQRGNFKVFSPLAQELTGFSLNDAREESQLEPRVSKEQVEALLGDGSVLEFDYRVDLKQALADRFSQPTELFPLLMILILLALAIENLLANKFYRQDSQDEVVATVKVPEPAASETKREEAAAR